MSYTAAMRPSGSPQELEQRRFRALALLQQGLSPVEVAQRVGVDRRSLRRWNSAARRQGREALRAQPAPGRPSRLSPGQQRVLQRALLRGAEAAGFSTPLWTCPRVAVWIEQRFGIRYHRDHVCRLLHALGFTPQKPARRAVERDEEAIGQWVKQQWPAVKKKRRA
jgi:transposase